MTKLVALLGTSGEAPYSNNAPTNTLETFLSLVLGQLVQADESLEIKPALLERAQYNYQHEAYELQLRPGTIFHNGRTATAEDLEFSLVHHLMGEYGSWFRLFFDAIEGVSDFKPPAQYRSGLISGIRIAGPLTVFVFLKYPNPSFLHSLARSYFSLVPKEELSPRFEWRKFPIGAGPYRVATADLARGATLLEKAQAGGGPDQIEVHMKSVDRPDVSAVGPTRECHQIRALPLPSGITMLNFNFENEMARDEPFRRRVRQALAPEKMDFEPHELAPADQLLPRHFWGRAHRISLPASAEFLPVKTRIFYYDSGSNSSTFYSFLPSLVSQLAMAGIETTLEAQNHKYQRSASDNFIGEISTIGADVIDPLVLFNVFREGSPLKPYVPSPDADFEADFYKAKQSLNLDDRIAKMTALADTFESKSFAVPLFERFTTFWINPEVIADLGAQNSSLIIRLNNMEIR